MAQCVKAFVAAVSTVSPGLHARCCRQCTTWTLQIRLPCLKWKVNQLALSCLLHEASLPPPFVVASLLSFVALDAFAVCTNLNANARKSTGASRLNSVVLDARFHWTRISGCGWMSRCHMNTLFWLKLSIYRRWSLPFCLFSRFLHCFAVLHFSVFIISFCLFALPSAVDALPSTVYSWW